MAKQLTMAPASTTMGAVRSPSASSIFRLPRLRGVEHLKCFVTSSKTNGGTSEPNPISFFGVLDRLSVLCHLFKTFVPDEKK